MLDRRRFLQGKLSLPLWGGWLSQRRAAAAPLHAISSRSSECAASSMRLSRLPPSLDR
jgi:hypothetical protein